MTITYLHVHKGDNAGWWCVYNFDRIPTTLRKRKGWRKGNILFTRPATANEEQEQQMRNADRDSIVAYRYATETELLDWERQSHIPEHLVQALAESIDHHLNRN